MIKIQQMTTLPFYSLLNPAYGGVQDDGSNPFIMPPPQFAYKIGPNPFNLAELLENQVGETQIQHANSLVGGQTVADSGNINNYIIPQSAGMFAPEIYLPEPQYVPSIDIANQYEYKGAGQAATDAWTALVQAQIQLQENNPLGASTVLGRPLTPQELASRKLAKDTVDYLIRKLAPNTVGSRDLYYEQLQMLQNPNKLQMPVLSRMTQRDASVQSPEIIGDMKVADVDPPIKQEQGGSLQAPRPNGNILPMSTAYRAQVARGEMSAGNNNPILRHWATPRR